MRAWMRLPIFAGWAMLRSLSIGPSTHVEFG